VRVHPEHALLDRFFGGKLGTGLLERLQIAVHVGPAEGLEAVEGKIDHLGRFEHVPKQLRAHGIAGGAPLLFGCQPPIGFLKGFDCGRIR